MENTLQEAIKRTTGLRILIGSQYSEVLEFSLSLFSLPLLSPSISLSLSLSLPPSLSPSLSISLFLSLSLAVEDVPEPESSPVYVQAHSLTSVLGQVRTS